MPESIRFRATSRLAYAHALSALVDLARDSEGPEFTFGPMSLDQMELSGLEVTGEDLSEPTDILRQVPGLAEYPA